MELSDSQVKRMDYYEEVTMDSPAQYGTALQTIQSTSTPHFASCGYGPAQQGSGNEVKARPTANMGFDTDEVGDMKIKWEYVRNQDISVLAQQWENGKGMPSFRPWNPNFIHDETVPEPDVDCPPYCVCCFLVETCFKFGFPEHIDEIK